MKSTLRFTILLLSFLIAKNGAAQSIGAGEEALRLYYRNLEISLANYRLNEIPFEPAVVGVNRNDSLVGIANRARLAELDTFHLAVAIFQNNTDAFTNGDPARLKRDATLTMPTVGGLYEARDRFEKLNILDNKLDFFGDENIMRQGIRLPFGGKSTPAQTQPIAATIAPDVVWDVSLWGKRRAFTEHIEKLAELVSEKTQGEFVLNIDYGGLAQPRENLDGIAGGEFEMAQFCAGYHEEKNPSITVLELPFLGVESLEEERYISQWLYRHPAVLADFRRWNAIALMPSPLPQYNIAGVGAAPRSIADFSGLSVRATGGIGKAMAAVNAVPTPTIASEVKDALQSGQIEAVAFAPHAHMSFGTVDSALWWTTNLNPGTVNCPVVANADAVMDLSPEHLDALYGSINESLDHYMDNYNQNTMSAWGPMLDQKGIRRVTFGDAEINTFRNRVSTSAAAEWINRNALLGLPAQELYDLVKVALAGENPETTTSIAATDVQPSANVQELAVVESEPVVATSDVTSNNSEVAAAFVPQIVNSELGDNYLGLPRNSEEIATLSADPLQYPIEWEFNESATVGTALSQLANFIGYELIAEDSAVLNSYQRQLPLVQRRVSGVEVSDGFEILSGRGMITLFDHLSRTVRHVPKRNRQNSQDLPDCPADISLATQTAEGVLLLPGGSECRY